MARPLRPSRPSPSALIIGGERRGRAALKLDTAAGRGAAPPPSASRPLPRLKGGRRPGAGTARCGAAGREPPPEPLTARPAWAPRAAEGAGAAPWISTRRTPPARWISAGNGRASGGRGCCRVGQRAAFLLLAASVCARSLSAIARPAGSRASVAVTGANAVAPKSPASGTGLWFLCRAALGPGRAGLAAVARLDEMALSGPFRLRGFCDSLRRRWALCGARRLSVERRLYSPSPGRCGTSSICVAAPQMRTERRPGSPERLTVPCRGHLRLGSSCACCRVQTSAVRRTSCLTLVDTFAFT